MSSFTNCIFIPNSKGSQKSIPIRPKIFLNLFFLLKPRKPIQSPFLFAGLRILYSLEDVLIIVPMTKIFKNLPRLMIEN